MYTYRALLTGILLIGACFTGAADPTPEEIFSDLRTRTGRSAGSIQKLMERGNIPGVSLAVIRDFQIAWTYTLGVADRERGRAVDDDTLFQAASISKPVGAAIAHVLAQQGKFDLEAPIADYLKSWQLPPYDFPGAPVINARLLMSHRAGVSVPGFDGCPGDLPVPSIIQVLNGDSPCNPEKVAITMMPGEKFEYSGGGISILQLAVMDITGESIEDVAQELVLKPVGMVRSTFQQPLPESLRTNAAIAYLPKGDPVKGGFNTQPELFAAGLWTTPSDLCRFAIAIQNALRGEGETPFTKESAIDMTTSVADGPTSPGFFVNENYFFHGGSNIGYRCMLRVHKSKGYGFAFMCNSDNGNALRDMTFEALGRAYGWDE